MTPYLTVDLERIIKNYRAYSRAVGGKKIIAVVKADGYGLGAKKIAAALSIRGCNDLAVATIEEGVLLRDGGYKGNILVLGMTPACEQDVITEYDLIQTLVDREHADSFTAKNMKAAVKLNVGMNRFGLNAADEKTCVCDIRTINEKLMITDLYTHFPCADRDGVQTVNQYESFKRIVNGTSDIGIKRIHCSASAAGVLHFDESPYTRLGISLYGLTTRPDIPLLKGIKQACSLFGRVCLVRRIKRGEKVGYGGVFTAKRDSVIAVINAGYADGIPRQAANSCDVFIRFSRARIVAVCMDVCLVDATNVSGISVGDDAEFFGDRLPVSEISCKIGTIDYEIVTKIGDRVRRVYK